MKKAILFFAGLLLITSGTVAQCGSCSTTVSNLSALNYVVSSGQTLCITATGTVTGLIAVSGGTLCNAGHIQSSNVWIGNGSYFSNTGTADIDSLLITGTGSALYNTGTMIHERLATTDHAGSSNSGSITVDFLGDSVAVFTNHGNLLITSDLYNAYSSTFSNYGMMQVNRDLFNSTNSSMGSTCMVDVQRNWYNSATITSIPAALQPCGGFRIHGLSFNSGTVTSVGSGGQSSVDICDTGNPPSHFDGNTGSVGASVTYCTCTNNCSPVTSVHEQATPAQIMAYPNPATEHLSLSSPAPVDMVEIYNANGQLAMRLSSDRMVKDGDAVRLPVGSLGPGIYFILGKSKGQAVFGSRFVKE